MAKIPTARTVTKKPDMEMEIVPVSKLNATWDFDFNCRAPSKGSKAYKDMMETLETNPAKFNGWNCGIHLANGKHILDGGHTYTALLDARREGIDVSGVFVKLFKYNNLTDKQMAEKSKHLNNKVTPPLRGEKDVMGEWDGLKAALAKKHEDNFEFRPNTKPNAPFKVDFLAALLHAITADTAIRSYSGKGVLVRLYKDEKYEKQLRHINKAIELYSQIMKDLAANKKMQGLVGVDTGRDMKLPSGETVKTFIPEGYIWPLFGAFSLLLDSDGNWVSDPLEVWKASKVKMLSQLMADYRSESVGNKHYNKLGKSREAYLSQQRWVKF